MRESKCSVASVSFWGREKRGGGSSKDYFHTAIPLDIFVNLEVSCRSVCGKGRGTYLFFTTTG